MCQNPALLQSTCSAAAIHLLALHGEDGAVLPGGSARGHEAHTPDGHALCQLLLDHLQKITS